MAPAPVKVLLVDDDEDDQVMFRDLLGQISEQSYLVEWAHSYERGQEKLRAGDFDVCFIDYRLGGRTGLDFLKEALGGGVVVPIIMLTGYGEQEVDLKAMEYGAADYLVKDQVSPLLLERSIRYSIHRAKSLEAIREREAQILVQDRMASVGLLASSLAHEIGTPLGVIRGRAEYLEMQVDNPGVKRNVEVIISQIDRVSQLIRSLLNLARGETKQKLSSVSVSQVLGEVTDLMGHEFRRHEIELKNSVEPEAKVMAEPGPFHQVLLNLLINSVHAIVASKKGRGEIEVSTEIEGEELVISVRDTGCGISPANMKNLFKPFFTTKDIGSGTGLGLATIYRIVEAWGGRIEAESVEGEGATFRVTLPKA